MTTYLIDVLSETIRHRFGFHEQSIMFVGGLWKAHSVRLFAHSFAIWDDRVRDLQRDTSVIFLEILETDLKMQLTGSSNDVLTRFFNWTLNNQSINLCNKMNKLLLILLLLLQFLDRTWVSDIRCINFSRDNKRSVLHESLVFNFGLKQKFGLIITNHHHFWPAPWFSSRLWRYINYLLTYLPPVILSHVTALVNVSLWDLRLNSNLNFNLIW